MQNCKLMEFFQRNSGYNRIKRKNDAKHYVKNIVDKSTKLE